MKWSLGLISDLVFFGWCIFIISILSFKGFTFENELKGKPHIKHGNRVVYTGGLFEKKIDSVTYNKRQWFTYCPLIHKKPKQWGKHLR